MTSFPFRDGVQITDRHARARRRAALLVGLITIVVGIVGIVHPDGLTAVRRSYFATPGRLYAAGAFRLVMGLVLILVASVARWPRMLRVFGAMMCLQAMSAMLMGAEHAQVILEWETVHTMLLRLGAVVALVSGCLITFAVAAPSRDAQRSATRNAPR